MSAVQLGFGFEEMAEAERIAYLPATMEAAIPFYRELLARHHAAMMAGDEERTEAIREEAHDLACRLNGDRGHFGILGGPDAPGCVLERETAAPPGTIPLWGQVGDYIVQVGGMRIRIEQDGIFGVCSGWDFWMAFGAHIVDQDKPFLSETGYRSFLSYYGPMKPGGITPDQFARSACAEYIEEERTPARKRKKKGKK